jgi:DNA invertase Pin-like site-specific DNA recombinase
MAMSVSPADNKRAIGYFRVSSTKQTGERHSSLETKKAHFREYCDRQGLDAVAAFIDVVTGRRDDRREYQRTVKLALAGGNDVNLVRFSDRFVGRNEKEILRHYRELEDHGVMVFPTDEKSDEVLGLLVKAGLAAAESRRTSGKG